MEIYNLLLIYKWILVLYCFKWKGAVMYIFWLTQTWDVFLAVCGRGKDEEITGRVCVLFILRRQHDIVFTNLKHSSTLYVDSFSSEMIVKERITSIYSLLLMIMIIFFWYILTALLFEFPWTSSLYSRKQKAKCSPERVCFGEASPWGCWFSHHIQTFTLS